MVEAMRTTATSSKRAHARTSAALQRPPLTQASPGDSCTLPGKSGSVSCGVTAPFSWVRVHKVLLCPPRVYFPVLCKFRRLYGGVNGDLLQEVLFHTQVSCTQSRCLCSSPLQTHALQETLKHSSVSVSVGFLGPGVPKVCLSHLSISGGYGV